MSVHINKCLFVYDTFKEVVGSFSHVVCISPTHILYMVFFTHFLTFSSVPATIIVAITSLLMIVSMFIIWKVSEVYRTVRVLVWKDCAENKPPLTRGRVGGHFRKRETKGNPY